MAYYFAFLNERLVQLDDNNVGAVRKAGIEVHEMVPRAVADALMECCEEGDLREARSVYRDAFSTVELVAEDPVRH